MSTLTPEQVAQLPDDALIRVTWSGGNGPHLYRVRRDDSGLVCAAPDYPNHRVNPLTFIGDAPPYTTVELIQLPSVYVLIGLVDGCVRQCLVMDDLARATDVYHRLQTIYGGANAAMLSRYVGNFGSLGDALNTVVGEF